MPEKITISAKEHVFEQYLIQSDHFPLQLQTAFLVFFVCQGECQIRYGSNIQWARARDFFFFPPDAIWQLQTQGDEITLYCLSISRDYLDSCMPLLTNCDLDQFHIPWGTSSPVYHKLCRHLSRVIFPPLFPSDDTSLVSLTYVHMLLLDIFRECRDGIRPVAAPTDYVQERLAKILEYIELNYRQKLLLEDISSAIGLHPQYFSQFFREHFQEKFLDYLNHFRVSRSLSELAHSDQPILNIALDHGFQSSNAYSQAFLKYYQVLPSVWRKQHGNRYAETIPEQDFVLQSTQYLYAYYKAPEVDQIEQEAASISLTMDEFIDNTPVQFFDRRIRIISVGSGDFLLRNSVYERLKHVAGTCAFTHVHIRNVFSDMMRVYTEPIPDHPIYSWEDLDQVVERITGLGMYPVMEIGFMPSDLASGNVYLSFARSHPNLTYPNSLQKWKDMIRAMLLHYKRIYKDAIYHWRFDFWTTGNIRSDQGFWGGTQAQFFQLYKATWETFHSVDPRLKLGTPCFSLPDGISWYEDFLSFCKQESLEPSYLCIHLYSCLDNLEHFNGVFPYSPTTYNYLSLTNTEYICELILRLKTMLQQFGFSKMPIQVSEWNITFYMEDLIRDTAFMATYIALVNLQTMDLVDGLGFFCLSDENDQSRPNNHLGPFGGNFGLFSRPGYPKAAYFAFVLLHHLDSAVIKRGDNYIITKSDRGFHVLVFNICDYEKRPGTSLPEHISEDHRYQVFRDTASISFRGRFWMPRGSYRITQYDMNRDHGSPYDTWLSMGKPVHHSEAIAHAIYYQAHPLLHCREEYDTELIHLEDMIKPHGIVLFEIERIQPDRSF